jgi:hypothetical protein
MQRTITALALPPVAIVGSGCASTQIRSQLDPQVRGRTYGKLLIWVNVGDLGLRQDAERRFTESLAHLGVDAVRCVETVFPGRTYSDAQWMQLLRDFRAHAILVAADVDSRTCSAWVPQTTSTEGTATVTGNAVSGRSTTTSSGGFYVEKPWAQFEANLHDVVSGDVLWLAQMNSGGNAFAGWDDLIRSMAKKTSEQLQKDGVIR